MKAIHDHFKLKRPCSNCPFLKVGAIKLEPGRLAGIIESLLQNDQQTFLCHKTVHNGRTGGDWNEDGGYKPSGRESMCAGAAIYLEKVGRPNIQMRIGRVMKAYHPDELRPAFDDVIEPLESVMDEKLTSEIKQMTRAEIIKVLEEQGGYQCYDEESTEDLRRTLMDDVARGLYSVIL